MPLRNLWSLNPGELRVAEKLLEIIPGSAVYFPVRDMGIDLLLATGTKHVSIQVKESRYYEYKIPRSWHQVSDGNLRPGPKSKRVIPDYFIFLTYLPNVNNWPTIAEQYLIVPSADLVSLTSGKRLSQGKYSFYFRFEEDRVSDIREKPAVDYTKFLDKDGAKLKELSGSI
jgi:hypothetical protein